MHSLAQYYSPRMYIDTVFSNLESESSYGSSENQIVNN